MNGKVLSNNDSFLFAYAGVGGKSEKRKFQAKSYEPYNTHQIGLGSNFNPMLSVGLGDLFIDFNNLGASYSNLGHSFSLPSDVPFMSPQAQQLLAGPTPWQFESMEIYVETTNNVHYKTNMRALNLLIASLVVSDPATTAELHRLILDCAKLNHRAVQIEMLQILDYPETDDLTKFEIAKLQLTFSHPGYDFIPYHPPSKPLVKVGRHQLTQSSVDANADLRGKANPVFSPSQTASKSKGKERADDRERGRAAVPTISLGEESPSQSPAVATCHTLKMMVASDSSATKAGTGNNVALTHIVLHPNPDLEPETILIPPSPRSVKEIVPAPVLALAPPQTIWEWKNDNSGVGLKFTPFDQKTTALIEAAFQTFNTNSTARTLTLTHGFFGNTPGGYTIDFVSMEQTKVKTNYKRKVQRRVVTPKAPKLPTPPPSPRARRVYPHVKRTFLFFASDSPLIDYQKFSTLEKYRDLCPSPTSCFESDFALSSDELRQGISAVSVETTEVEQENEELEQEREQLERHQWYENQPDPAEPKESLPLDSDSASESQSVVGEVDALIRLLDRVDIDVDNALDDKTNSNGSSDSWSDEGESTSSTAITTSEERVYTRVKSGYPCAIIADVEWDEEREAVLFVPVHAPYLHIVCIGESDTHFSPQSFEFVGYCPEDNNGVPLAAGKSPLVGVCPPFPRASRKREYPFDHVEPFSPGVLDFLGRNKGRNSIWKNPATALKLALSHPLHNKATMSAENVIRQSGGVQTFFGAKTTPLWFSIDLGPKCSLRATAFSLRHGYNSPNSYPKDLVLEASHNYQTWVPIKVVSGNPFKGAFDEKSFLFGGQKVAYRYWRVLQKGNYAMNSPTAIGKPLFCVSGFELYGTLLDEDGVVVVGADFGTAVKECRAKIVSQFVSTG
eukprot:TRINITY_DN1340_c0_g1_i1.p1 TRINITY_DN1340_c0_g1~~TRINITY_DN1340_c0_g1_i1.p1  ORF type:complete len:1012 (-),score=162.82 TRINITY_DN1340_c0_g1_i1:125-2833(-)